MCGINGILLKEKNKIKQRIDRMNASLAHRGPDASGVEVFDNERVAFGHRRLSIIDLDERSTQPMYSESGRYLIVFNGEIYNYQDLKQMTSYAYKTNSDTEVILAYVECFGLDEFLKIANGMYAFALYDTESGMLHLCRDRMGIKPLYYYGDNEKFIFSSEIKGILNSGLVQAVFDKEAMDDYLAYRYSREPYTFFESIFQVKSGTYITIEADGFVREKRYWDIPAEFNMAADYDEAAIMAEFEKQLNESVLKRMVADVPLGTYLSGGVDSSMLTAIVARNSDKNLNTYTIGFNELNEFEYSDMVAKRYNTTHHKIVMSKNEYFELMRDVIGYKDAPLGVPNEIPLAVMSKELKKQITVVLSGEGADELLGGYGRIFRSPFDFANSGEEDFYRYFINKYEYVSRAIRDDLFGNANVRRAAFDNMIGEEFSNNINEYNVFYFFHKYHIKGLLQRVDTTTMLAGVEARVPFLDHKLVEYSYREIPYSLKLHWNSAHAELSAKKKVSGEYSEVLDTPKYLLKQLAYKYIPKEVIERKKVGFPVPLNQWNTDIENMLENLCSKDIMDKKACERLIKHCETERIGSQIMWMFLNVSIFADMYFNKEWRW